MKKICSLACLVFVLCSTAQALQTVDVQNASNWGDWFIPDDADPYPGELNYDLSPYYRWHDGDW